MTDDFPVSVTYPGQNYADEITLLLDRMKTVTTEKQYAEIEFFDNKGTIGGSLYMTLIMGSGLPMEEIIWIGLGTSTAVYDGGIAVWRVKLANSRVRPPTVLT